MKKATILTILSVGSLIGIMFAQAPKKASTRYPLLQPEFSKVEGGSYDKPMGTLGQKASQAWTGTTMAAGVDGKPQAGAPMTLTGEIVDFSCYLQLGKHGEKHRSCGQKCLQAGQPIGLLTSDGNLYMVMEEEHDPRRDGLTDFRKPATDHLGHIMEVSGTLAEHAGYRALFVQGYLKK